MTASVGGLRVVLGVLALMGLSQAAVAADRPFTEGTVSMITSVRTVDGGFEDYLKWLSGPWQDFMEAQKKAGVIVDYHVFVAQAGSPEEPDLYLQVVYKNFAALDGLDDKVEPIGEKLMGSQEKQTQDMIARGKIRTVLGEQTVRELVLK